MSTPSSSQKKICANCIGEPYLARFITSASNGTGCSYCQGNDPSAPLEALMPHIEFAFEEHYERTAEEPEGYELAALNDRESNYCWYRAGEPTHVMIAEIAEIPEQAAIDLQELLFDKHANPFETEEQEFDPEAHYTEKRSIDTIDLHASWEYLEHIVKTKNRFFSKDVRDILSNIFNNIDQLSSRVDLVIDIGPGTTIDHVYRARYVHGDDLDKVLERPDLHLGPPPAHLALAGRMNSHGIAMFYGAEDSDTAIAEVRPPVGGFVISGKFTFNHQLRVLDLHAAITGRDYVASLFDPDSASKIKKLAFLKSLSHKMSQPVSPHDTALAYISTQVIADYLSTENTPTLDGIIFPSSQTGLSSRNLVLFHHASRITPIDYPIGTTIEASSFLYNGEEHEKEFTVFVSIPEEETAESQPSRSSCYPFHTSHSEDDRSYTLSIDPNDLEIVRVESVSYRYEHWGYQRYTIKKRDNTLL